MWDPTPWALEGGARISAAVGRLLAYASTSGAEGIVEPKDLKVTATPTPGENVRVAPGAALVRNRYAGGGQQTYVARNRESHNKKVTKTGSSSGRSDLVIVKIHDPQYGGTVPANPVTFQYVTTEIIETVPAGTTSVDQIPDRVDYPALALARIDIPVNTQTITDAMIVNVRKVARPRQYRRLFAFNLEGDAIHALTSTNAGGQFWPQFPEPIWWVDVPEWATHAQLVATWGGVRVSRSAANGTIWVRLGPSASAPRTQDQKWALDFSALANEEMRETWVAVDDIAIPEAIRGTSQAIRMMGKVLGAGGPPRLDNAASVSVDIQFTEGPA